MIEMKWNKDTVEIWENGVLKYDLKGRNVYSHLSKRAILLSTLHNFLLKEERKRDYASTDKLAESIMYIIYECEVYLSNNEYWETFEKIQKACPEVKIELYQSNFNLFKQLSAKEKKELYKYIKEKGRMAYDLQSENSGAFRYSGKPHHRGMLYFQWSARF